MGTGKGVKVIPFYFPQFHAIPENDEWWGKGFTDWVNVRKARPKFQGHYQPRVPLGSNYYDESRKEVIRWQIDLAKKYGLYGFCHYHYWFDGKQLLETPTNIVIESKELDFPFCLAWANETWSRRWDGLDHDILQLQTHDPDESKWLAHFNYLIKAWSDERAIKIDGKPVFVIYRPHKIVEIGRMFEFWRKKANEHGLKGIYFIAVKQQEYPSEDVFKYFDAVLQFQPFEAMLSPDFQGPELLHSRYLRPLVKLPHWAKKILWLLWAAVFERQNFYDYDSVWRQILKEKTVAGKTTFPGAFADWDNTARYGKRAIIFKGTGPERFEFWFQQLVQKVAEKPIERQFIFFNAWNEWAEGTYLEPDEKYKYQFLEAVKRCIDGA